MSETFSKLFSSITDSSVWSESHETVRVWITMLAMADQHGYVGAAVPGLAARARVTLEECEIALAKFLAPDPYSRSKDHDGRRIEVSDRGWVLLNYPRFRDMRDEEVRKTYERDRKRRQRAEAKAREGGGEGPGRRVQVTSRTVVPDSPDPSPDVPPSLPPSAHTDPELTDPDPDPEAPPPTPPNMEEPGSHVSSGVLHEIDVVRRQVEAETGHKIGGLTHRVDKLDGLAPAVQEYGLPRVLEVVAFRCEQVATGEVSPALWRRLFSGDGFHAALEQAEKSERAVARARELVAETQADPVADEETRARIGELADVVTFPRPKGST